MHMPYLFALDLLFCFGVFSPPLFHLFFTLLFPPILHHHDLRDVPRARISSLLLSLFANKIFILICSYSKKTSLFTHHKTHPEHCVHCGENRGSSVENIYTHNQLHIKIRPFVCKVCGESFLRNQQFVEHEKSHDVKRQQTEEAPTAVAKESKYKCKEPSCLSSFTNWKLFYKHQQETGHVNEKFLCEICGSEFFSNFLLSQHRRRVHKRTGEFIIFIADFSLFFSFVVLSLRCSFMLFYTEFQQTRHSHAVSARKCSQQSRIWIRISKRFTPIARSTCARCAAIRSRVRQISSSTSRRCMKPR